MERPVILEYPSLKGKVIKQVRFTQEDEEFTAVVLEFDDDTHVSFALKANIALAMEPEISKLKNGDIVNWRKVKAQVVEPGGRRRAVGRSMRRG